MTADLTVVPVVDYEPPIGAPRRAFPPVAMARHPRRLTAVGPAGEHPAARAAAVFADAALRSLAVRDGGPAAVRRAVEWYRGNDRLHTGDEIAMAAAALAAYRVDITMGKDALLVCDTTEMCDALNRRKRDGEPEPHPLVRVNCPTLVMPRRKKSAQPVRYLI